ncbi:MAG: hypothetical protein ABIT71_12695 [Vicinamibacteraceae bacterium]
MLRRTLLVAAAFASAPLAPAHAQSPDVAAIAKWTAAKVVHYHMVGVYQGPAVIAYREPAGQATVTDRVEIDLDWDLQTKAIVGEPTIVNAASEVRQLHNTHASCPAPTPNGPYDHLDVKTVTVAGGALELKGIRSFPSVAVVAGCQGVQEPRTTRPWQQDVVDRMVVPSPLMLAAPAGSDTNLTVSADKASFTIAGGAWTWTYTPSIVN